MSKNSKAVMVIGFALFASFFGAGNLIFPPSIGIAAGNQWPIAMAAFILSGVILPICSFIAVSKGNGTEEGIAKELGPVVSKVIIALVMVCGSLIIVIPRTAAVTYEMGIKTFIPSLPQIVCSIVYFLIVLLFSFNQSTVIDKIGKFLTPFLLAAMSIIVIKGIINSIGTPTDVDATNVFANSFVGGYQTLDAIGAIAFSGAIMSAIVGKGYTDLREQRSIAFKCALVAGVGLLFIYGGLCYIGATGSGTFSTDMTNTELLLALIQALMGTTGMKILSVAVTFACLTTAIGATAGFASFFARVTNNRITYKSGVIVTVVCGILISTLSVDQIVSMALPILLTIYPVVIVLILLGMVNQYIPCGKKGIYIGAVYSTFAISLLETIASYVSMHALSNLLIALPLSSYGFTWFVPAVICGTVGFISTKNKKEGLE